MKSPKNDREFRGTVEKQLCMSFRFKNKKELAKVIQMSERSLYTKLADPEQFRLGEVRKLCDVLNFSEEERQIII